MLPTRRGLPHTSDCQEKVQNFFEGPSYTWFQHDSATLHTVEDCVIVSERGAGVFRDNDKLSFIPVHPSYLTGCDFYS
jgi:hypothetical protein